MSESRARRPGAALALLIAALCCACPLLAPGEPPAEPDVRPERLRTVPTFDMEAMSPERAAEPEGAAGGAPAPVEAPPAELSLTLQECRAAALAGNLDLQVELIRPTLAREDLNEQEAAFEPSLFANGSYSRTEALVTPPTGESVTEMVSADAGVTFPLHTGGTITLDMPYTRAQTEGVGAAAPSHVGGAAVSVSQPLLRGGGVEANTYFIRLARYESQISESRARLEVTRVLASVDRVYWRLYAARRELEVRKEEYDLAVAQLERAKRMVAAGTAAEVEIVRAETGVAEQLEAIIVADNAVRDRERELKRVLNRPDLPVQGATVLVPGTPPDAARHDLDLARITRAALDNRMELLELELRLAQDAGTVRYEQNQALPFLAVDYTYSVNGLGPTRSDAYDMLFDRPVQGHSVGLQLTVPLGNAAAEARVRRALYAKAQALATRDSRVQQIEQEVAGALDQLESNWQRVVASGRRTELAARNLAAEERQFGLGLRTSTEVLDAQTRYSNARSAEVSAITECQISKVDLAFATGMLLSEAGVVWSPLVPETSQ